MKVLKGKRRGTEVEVVRNHQLFEDFVIVKDEKNEEFSCHKLNLGKDEE